MCFLVQLRFLVRMRRRIACATLLVVLVGGAGCRRAATAPDVAGPGAAKNAAAVQGASHGAAANGPALDRTLGRALAQLTCPVPLRSGQGDSITCDACPTGSDFAPRAGDPASAHEGWWTLTDTVLGHFSAPGADEAVLHAEGCESHADGLGGDFLLRRQQGDWHVVRYVHALPGSRCHALRMSSGRDALLCQTSDMHQGIIEDAVGLFTIGNKGAPDPDSGEDSVLLYTTDETETCADDHAGNLTVRVGNVTAVDLLPPGPNGLQDVRVRAKLGMARYAKLKDEHCPPMPMKEYEVVYRNRGDHLQAGSGSTALRALMPRYDHTLQVAERVVPAVF